MSTSGRPCLTFGMEIWIHFLQKKQKKQWIWLVFGFWFKKHLPCQLLNKNFGQKIFFILIMLAFNAFIKFVDGFDYHKYIYISHLILMGRIICYIIIWKYNEKVEISPFDLNNINRITTNWSQKGVNFFGMRLRQVRNSLTFLFNFGCRTK